MKLELQRWVAAPPAGQSDQSRYARPSPLIHSGRTRGMQFFFVSPLPAHVHTLAHTSACICGDAERPEQRVAFDSV